MAKGISLIVREMRKTVGRKAVVEFDKPFKVLIATVLSQRTKDQNTERASRQLFKKYRAPREIAGAPIAELRRLIKPAGFYKVKAGRIKEISRQIVERFSGRVPESIEELLSLPGVGRKTANCVLVYGFKKPAIPVDVHVHRISNRIGIVKTRTPEQTEEALRGKIKRRYWIELNHLMVRFGQSACLPRKPRCPVCRLQRQCDYFLAVASKKKA
ncbi:MAG: endonuclease III [Candidatus Diapherotrites archaeon]|nr:endonuclease III [Candidatus Diapherotrites archaeon]